MGGATKIKAGKMKMPVVSILAPRFWGALPGWGWYVWRVGPVSILAPRFWGALQKIVKENQQRAAVSILAPRFWGALRGVC